MSLGPPPGLPGWAQENNNAKTIMGTKTFKLIFTLVIFKRNSKIDKNDI